MTSLSSQLAFVRRVTPGKLAARVALMLKRQTLQRLPVGKTSPVLAESVPPLAPVPPQPLFAPRSAGRAIGETRFELTFLHRSRTFTLPFDWHPPELARGTRLWKLNLHYHEFLESFDDRSMLAVMTDWIEQNEKFRPQYWMDSWNSYALSIRVVVWMQQLSARRLERHPQVQRLILPSLVAQLRFLLRNLELDIGGNHLIKNIKALAWAGAFFAGQDAAQCRRTAIRLLRRQLDQVLADGMHYERSPSYHAQVFADLVEIRQALGADPFGGAFDEVLTRMTLPLRLLVHPDGTPALFNDAGITMAFSAEACLAAFGRIGGRSVREPMPGAFALPASGYYGFRSPGCFIVADCGRIAPDDLPAHGHGDVLAFELSWSGLRFVVDQGVLEYDPGPARDASRSAARHNTLCVEGSDQAEFFGSFRVGRRPNPQVEALIGGTDTFHLTGSHDGFAHLPGAPRHRRSFDANEHALKIADFIEGSTDRAARISFLLHPDVRCQRAAEGAILLTRERVNIQLAASVALDLEDAVWWPEMGLELATKRIVAAMPNGRREAHFTFSAAA